MKHISPQSRQTQSHVVPDMMADGMYNRNHLFLFQRRGGEKESGIAITPRSSCMSLNLQHMPCLCKTFSCYRVTMSCSMLASHWTEPFCCHNTPALVSFPINVRLYSVKHIVLGHEIKLTAMSFNQIFA